MPVVDINVPSEAKDKFMPMMKKGWVLCLYYWKHCGFCISFHPIWDKVTKYYKDRINAVSIELDCLKELDKKYSDVNGFPTITLYQDGKEVKQFTNKRTEDELHKFIQSEILKNEKAAKKPKKETKSKTSSADRTATAAAAAAAAGGSLRKSPGKPRKSRKTT